MAVLQIDGESAGTTPWEWDSLQENESGVFSLEAGAANGGSYGYQADWGATPGGDCQGLVAFTEQTDVYVRFYFNPDTPGTSHGNTTGMFSIMHDWGFLVVLRLATDGSNYGLNVGQYHNGGSAWSTFDADCLTSGVFNCIEVRWLQGSSLDGGVEVWVDGASIGSDFNYSNDTLGANRLRVGGIQTWDRAVDGIWYYDDLVVDSSYIGLLDVDTAVVPDQEGVAELHAPTVSATQEGAIVLPDLEGVAELHGPTIIASSIGAVAVDHFEGVAELHETVVGINVNVDHLEGVSEFHGTHIGTGTTLTADAPFEGVSEIHDPVIIVEGVSFNVQPGHLEGVSEIHDPVYAGELNVVTAVDYLTGVAEQHDVVPVGSAYYGATVAADHLVGVGIIDHPFFPYEGDSVPEGVGAIGLIDPTWFGFFNKE